MGGLILLNIKVFFREKVKLLFLLVLLAGISLAAGLLGNHFLTDGILSEPITIAMVDLDDGFETRMILATMTDDYAYGDVFEFVQLSPLQAQNALAMGNLAAYVTFPEGFGRSMITGINMPFIVTYNDDSPLVSALVRVAIDAFAHMLRHAQTGVYTALDYADTQNLTGGQFDTVLMSVNMRFLGLVLARNDIFVQNYISAAGGLSLAHLYGIAMFLALMLCVAFVMTDAMRRNFTDFFMLKLRRSGVSPLKVYLACFIANFLLFAVIIAGVSLYLFGFSANIILASLAISAGFAGFASMLVFLFDSSFAAGAFAAVFAAVSLFLSGGIVPVDFFGPWLQTASGMVFNSHAAGLVYTALLDESVTLPLLTCLAFAAIFMLLGLAAACNRGRVKA